jgi:hypothetical protein
VNNFVCLAGTLSIPYGLEEGERLVTLVPGRASIFKAMLEEERVEFCMPNLHDPGQVREGLS